MFLSTHYSSLFSVLLSLFLLLPPTAKADLPFSPATENTIARFGKLDSEVEYGRTVAEKLLRCSYVQNAWLIYLHEAESREDFLRGMLEIEQNISHFRTELNYAATAVNFFHPGNPRTLFPQKIPLENGIGFLNTFKTGKNLTEQERSEFFEQEFRQYSEESLYAPFELDETTLQRLESGTIYNFTLLPDGTIRAALEKPGGRDYLLDPDLDFGDFAYPNHTILAGSPHQPVITAGSLILYQVEDKRLFFISNKSGHFVPSFKSLEFLNRRLQQYGVDRHTVITVPTLDLGEVLISLYHYVQIPLVLLEEDIERLFNIAHQKWMAALDKLDSSLLEEFASGNFERLTREAIGELNSIREEATYMRSAYHLFAHDHQAPSQFHKFVKHFGHLKDAIKHNIEEKVIKEASWLTDFLQRKGHFLGEKLSQTAQEHDLYEFLIYSVQTLRDNLSQERLSIDDFHHIKKSARELGALFLLLTDDFKYSGRNQFINNAAAWKLLRFNQQLAVIHDAQVGKLLRGEVHKEEIVLQVPQSIQNQLNCLLNRLGIAPPTMKIKIEPEAAFWLINEAKEWYLIHHWISCHPEENAATRNYNPLPARFLQKVHAGNYDPEDNDNAAAVDILKMDLRAAEVARNALIYLDASHGVDPFIELYINTLRTILQKVENNDISGMDSELAIMLAFLDDPGVRTSALEKYQLSDQISFEQTIRQSITALDHLQNSTISKGVAFEIREKVQSLADLFHLYLLIGQKYQNLPSIAYEEAKKDCEQLLEDLFLEEGLARKRDYLNISSQIRLKAARLKVKFQF